MWSRKPLVSLCQCIFIYCTYCATYPSVFPNHVWSTISTKRILRISETQRKHILRFPCFVFYNNSLNICYCYSLCFPINVRHFNSQRTFGRGEITSKFPPFSLSTLRQESTGVFFRTANHVVHRVELGTTWIRRFPNPMPLASGFFRL